MNHARNRSRAVIALLATLMMLFGGMGAATAQSDDPGGDIGTHIVGGRDASQVYPAAAAIEYNSTEPARVDWLNCTANLIRTDSDTESDWAVTASHCVTNLPTGPAAALGDRPDFHLSPVWVPVQNRDFHLKIGATDRSTARPVAIKRIVVHPGWRWIPDDSQPSGDFTLIQLAKREKTQPVPLATWEPRPGSRVRALGWGRTSNDATEGSRTLRELDTRIVPSSRCAGGLITAHDLCTDESNPDSGTCNGDSGGPVTQWVGRWVQVGLVSRNEFDKCALAPDVHTGVAHYKRWADEVTTGKIRSDLPLTAEQGGVIPHPSIPITTTAPVAELPNNVHAFPTVPAQPRNDAVAFAAA